MSDSYALVTQEFNTIIDFLRFGLSRAKSADLYYGHGADNAWDDICALIFGSLLLPPDLDPLLWQAQLTADEKIFLSQQLERRIQNHVPVAYLTHEAYFCDLAFYVDQRVLIPRSPLAELISQRFSPWIFDVEVGRILDLCTGSGCIAIACCYAFPEALVDAVDIDAGALLVAEINRKRHGVQDVLNLIESDCFSKVPACAYDIIISNPPYVGHTEMQSLPKEYLHEPNLALEASNNGLGVVDKILAQALKYLSVHGILIVEVGNSYEAVLKAYPQLPFMWLDLEHGGSGVFLLTAVQLQAYFA